jgi:hypothetical protein
MPTHSLPFFPACVSDFDEIWHGCESTRETNTYMYQFSAIPIILSGAKHFKKIWWILQEYLTPGTKLVIYHAVITRYLKGWYHWIEETIPFPTICNMMTFLDVAHFNVMSHDRDLDILPNFSGSTSLFILLKFLVLVDYDLKRTSAKFRFGESVTSCENCRNTAWHTGWTIRLQNCSVCHHLVMVISGENKIGWQIAMKQVRWIIQGVLIMPLWSFLAHEWALTLTITSYSTFLR